MSHGGKRKGAGRKSVDGVTGRPKLVLLDPDTEAKAKLIGGSVSAGLRIAVRAYRVRKPA